MLGFVVGYLFGFLGSMPLTGPIAVVVLHQAFLGQFRYAFLIALGASIAESLYCALAMFGFELLLTKYPLVVEIIRTFSGILLIILGIIFMRSSLVQKRKKIPENSQARGFKRYLILGFTISALNPVLLITWATAITMFHSLTGIKFSLLGKILFPLAVPFGILSWFSVLLSLLKRHKEKLGIKLTTILIRTTSIILILVGLWVIVEQNLKINP